MGFVNPSTALRDECLNGEIFNILSEAQVFIEKWRINCKTKLNSP